jgi:hypothetical protein
MGRFGGYFKSPSTKLELIDLIPMGSATSTIEKSMFKSLSAEDYITKRVDQFQGWYDSKAVRAKNAYLRVRTTAVIGSALVPVVANIKSLGGFALPTDWLTTIISLIVVIVVALDSVNHYGDQWKNYRSTEQFLSRERFLFQTGEGPYRAMEEKEAFLLLVERCEAQISAENSATLNVIATAAAQPEPDTSSKGR